MTVVDKDVERTIKLDEHGQNIADREHQRKMEEERLRRGFACKG